MQTAAAGTCAKHRKRERVATCGVCGNDLCVDCVVHTAVGIKCRSCTGGAGATAPTASKLARAGGRAANRTRTRPAARPVSSGAGGEGSGGPERATGPARRRRWAIPMALVGVVAIVGAAIGLLAAGGGGDKTATKAGNGDEETGNSTETVERVADFVGAGGLKIGATLTIPAGVGAKKAPGVVIVPGGATLDRNGLITQVSQNDPLYEDLAKSLADAGIVSLRYDRRGTGASKLAEGTSKSFEDLVVDAKSAVDFLASRRETQGAKLGLLAYDSGGFVAMSLAAADARVKSLVLVSTPGRPLPDLLADDFVKEVGGDQGQALADGVRAAAAQVVSTGQLPRPETLPPALKPVFPPGEENYLKGLFAFNPVGEARRVQVPALVIRGSADTSITDADVANLKSNLAKGEQLVADNAGNTLALPPGQEGALHNPSRHGTVREPGVMSAINDWLKRNLSAT